MPNANRRSFLQAAFGAGSLIIMPGGLRPSYGQQRQPQTSRPARPAVAGVVVSLSGDTIQAHTAGGPKSIKLERSTRVWKRHLRNDASLLTPGDEIYATGHIDAAGNFVAEEIAANIVSFYGQIMQAGKGRFEILLHAPSPNGQRIVNYADDAIINDGRSSATDFVTGRFVQVIGLGLPDGSVQATRIQVYDQNRRRTDHKGGNTRDPFTGKIG